MYRINSYCGGLYAKRKCGVVRLSTERFWNTYVQINNTPHRIEYIKRYIAMYGDERCVIPAHLNFPDSSVRISETLSLN